MTQGWKWVTAGAMAGLAAGWPGGEPARADSQVLAREQAVIEDDLTTARAAEPTDSKGNAEPLAVASEDGWFPIEMGLTVAWDSLYVTEGRDNLDGKSLAGTTLEAGYEGFLVGTWLASSPDTDYREFNLFAEYGIEAFGFDLYAGYNYLNFLSDSADDHEVGAGISRDDLPLGLAAAFDWYHSFEAEGSFFELSIDREIELTDWLEFEPFAVLGWNEGYVADGHDGANHVACGLVCEIQMSEAIEIEGYVAYNWAIDSDPANAPDDELLKDFLYGGVSVSFSF